MRLRGAKLRQFGNGEAIKIFLKHEAEVLMALRHPHIVQMLDWGWDQKLGCYFIALEWVDRSLGDEMESGQPMAWPASFGNIGKPLVSALAYAHARQVECRDIKPGNVPITKDGMLRLSTYISGKGPPIEGLSRCRSWSEPRWLTLISAREAGCVLMRQVCA
jgi:serine/threonine protein kinase